MGIDRPFGLIGLAVALPEHGWDMSIKTANITAVPHVSQENSTGMTSEM